MQTLTRLDGLVAPLDRPNVDTDAIIPKQFLKSIRRTGFGQNLFDEWRYLDLGAPGADCTNRPLNPRFSLNEPRYMGAQILLTRENFGCGSSREHAVWALEEFGFRVLIAPSFGEIFYNNCLKNGVLPVTMSSEVVGRLFADVVARPGYRLQIDLCAQAVLTPAGETIGFAIDPDDKTRLLSGLDDIGLTLQSAAKIREYETRRRMQEPWLFSM